MEVKLPTEGTRYVQALLLTATAYLQYRAHFLPAVAAYRGYGRPAVPKVPVQALRACLAIGHGTLPLPSVAWLYEHERFLCPQTVYRGRSIPTGCSPVAHDESYSEAHKRRPKRDAGGREVPLSYV